MQPYSGSPANLAVYFALLKPGDTIMGMALPMGGHLTHGWNVSITGTFWRAVQYHVNRETQRIDYDAVRDLARREKPRIIVCGATAYPRIIDFKAFAEIAKEVGALCSPISRISPASSSAERIRARCRTPMSSRPRRTRRCAARAAP